MNDVKARVLYLEAMTMELPDHDTSEARCSQCGGHLGVHYCESGLYMVRCSKCRRVSFIKASKPLNAALKCGGMIKVCADCGLTTA